MSAGRNIIVVLGLVFWTAPAFAQQGSLGLRGPERLVAASPEVVPIRADVDGLRFFSNVGTIEAARSATDPDLRANYSLPPTQYPMVVFIVAATEDLRRFDWLAVPVYGAPTVRFQFEARSSVVVELGGRTFGPVTTDGRGAGEIALEVPPGVRSARAVGTDRLGNRREQAIPLDPPPFERFFALCSTHAVHLLAVDEEATPLATAPPMEGAGPALGALRSDGEGHFVARVRHDQPVRDGRVSFGEASCELPLAPPTSVTVRVDSDGWRASDVHVALDYPPGSPRLRVQPAVVASQGHVGALHSGDGVHFSAPWSWANGAEDVAAIEASVDGTPLQDSIEFRLPKRSGLRLELGAGAQTNLGKMLGPWILASGGLRVGLSARSSVWFGVAGGFRWGRDSGLDADGLEPVEVSMTAAAVLAEVGYRYRLARWSFGARVLGGTLIASTSLSAQSTGSWREREATWALGGRADTGPVIGPGILSIGLGYLYAPLEAGNAAGLSVLLAYALEL